MQFQNFFAIIHRIIRNCFTHPIRFAALKFAIVTPVLIGLLWFYVQCNKIPHFVDGIAIDRVGGEVTYENIDVNLFRNYSASFSHNLYGFNSELDSKYKGSYNAIQIRSAAIPGTLKSGKAPGDFHCNATIDQFFESANILQDWKKEYVDSVDVLYHIITQYKTTNGNSFITGNVYEYMNRYFHVLFPVYSIEKQHKDKSFFEFGYGIAFKNAYNVLFHTGSSAQKFSYFAPYDISQLYQTFNLTSPLDSITLNIDFWGDTRFSNMIPEPDEIGMSFIKFYSPEKLKQIKNGNLVFHARFSDTANIQSTRMFILATMITVVLSYWITLLGSIIANTIRNIHYKKPKTKS